MQISRPAAGAAAPTEQLTLLGATDETQSRAAHLQRLLETYDGDHPGPENDNSVAFSSSKPESGRLDASERSNGRR